MPKKLKMPPRIPDTPENIALACMQGPPKKKWRHLEEAGLTVDEEYEDGGEGILESSEWVKTVYNYQTNTRSPRTRPGTAASTRPREARSRTNIVRGFLPDAQVGHQLGGVVLFSTYH